MKRRLLFMSALAPALSMMSLEAQTQPRPVRIGWLTAQRETSLAPYIAVVRAALVSLGYVEGRNLELIFRYGDDHIERVPELAADLLRQHVDLILAQGAAVPVIYKLGLPIPVVYVFSGDPVTAGFASSLAHPRGNMTGMTFAAADLNGKRLQLLRDFMPALRRVAIVANPEHPGQHLERDYTEQSGRKLGLTISYYATRNRQELDDAFARMATEPPQAISLFADGFAIENRQAIIDFGMKYRVPTVSGWPVFALAGALFTYGPKLSDSYRRLASDADRILKGARPADIPIEQPSTFEMVVNARTAKALGLAIPATVLAAADSVIE